MKDHPNNKTAASKDASTKRPYKRPQITTCEATEPNALGSSCAPNLDQGSGCLKGW